ncbi:hypothetical protein ACN23B_24875 [Anabaena sp. FACHB-709]|uniref:Uncharacterized protein n=1 Tax=Trichormus variabilis NIES-23 TaxID=1973479 RepID=A0A1Z4KNQ5_ANAVA|nr:MULTISPECIES: hypothetical protein [Nostocaceae]BAY70567.1 hypothetical protein NIES23_33720 [Trichormus variabilis NIES-23]
MTQALTKLLTFHELTGFQGNSAIASPSFPQLNLTAQQILDAAN